MRLHRWCSLGMLLFVLLGFSACHSKTELTQGVLYEDDYYTVSRSGSEVYILFHKTKEIKPPEDSSFRVSWTLKKHDYFHSHHEMWDYFSGDSFSELTWIQNLDSTKIGIPVKLFDTEKTLEPIIPEDFDFKQDSQGCLYAGDHYSAGISSEGATGGIICFFNKELYQDFFEEEKVPGVGFVLVSETREQTRNATRYSYQHERTGEIVEYVCYRFWQGFKVRNVIERYDEGDTVPSTVSVYGKSSGGYFRAHLRDLSERPSMDTLRGFGLKIYGSTPIPTGVWFGIFLGVVVIAVIMTVLFLRRRKKAKAALCASGEAEPLEGILGAMDSAEESQMSPKPREETLEPPGVGTEDPPEDAE